MFNGNRKEIKEGQIFKPDHMFFFSEQYGGMQDGFEKPKEISRFFALFS